MEAAVLTPVCPRDTLCSFADRKRRVRPATYDQPESYSHHQYRPIPTYAAQAAPSSIASSSSSYSSQSDFFSTDCKHDRAVSPASSVSDLETSSEKPKSVDKDSGRYLVASPYTTQDHLLDLDTLNDPQRLISLALTHMQATTPTYATTPYIDAFNWPTVVGELRQLLKDRKSTSGYTWPETQSFYIVVFRSRIPPTTSRLELGQLDARSHAEATASGGLLKYWFGSPDTHGRNLATCVWRAQTDVAPASAGQAHREAMRKTRALYTEWKIERLRFWIGPGAETWGIDEWTN